MSALVEVLKEEEAQSTSPDVLQEYQQSGENVATAPAGHEEIEEVRRAPKEEEVTESKQEDKQVAAPEDGAGVAYVKEEPFPDD